MRHIAIIFLFVSLFTSFAFAQFRGQEPKAPAVSEKIQNPLPANLLFGFFNPDNFRMSHSISMNYMTMGKQSVGMTMYTNSMQYKIADPLTVRADLSMMYVPFGSFSQSFRNDISSIFLQRAQIDYQPVKDLRISLQYRQIPFGAVNPYYNTYSGFYGGFSPWYEDMP